MPTPTQEEQALLDILSADDLLDVAEIDESDATKDDIALDEEQRGLLTTLLNAQMPTPEEIAQDAQIAAHNAEVRMQRTERLQRRAARREKDAQVGKKCRKNRKHRRG